MVFVLSPAELIDLPRYAACSDGRGVEGRQVRGHRLFRQVRARSADTLRLRRSHRRRDSLRGFGCDGYSVAAKVSDKMTGVLGRRREASS